MKDDTCFIKPLYPKHSSSRIIIAKQCNKITLFETGLSFCQYFKTGVYHYLNLDEALIRLLPQESVSSFGFRILPPILK